MVNDTTNPANLHFGQVQMARRPPDAVGPIDMPQVMPYVQPCGVAMKASNP